MDYISGLNKMQKTAVEHGEGPLLILAGAGSGKTRVLTHRIAYLIEKKDIDVRNILAITFTNKAANEMRERLEFLLPHYIGGLWDMGGLWSGTFHSICVKILRFNIDKLGYDNSFTIYDRDDQMVLMRQCVKELDLDNKIYKEKALLNAIGGLKDKMLSPKDYRMGDLNYYETIVADVYELYEKKLKDNNALDFDDLILKTVDLLKADEEVLDYYSSKFEYIFVDEFQDTNGPQYELVRLLSSKHRNLCVVGDDDQSIYGFRGADIKNILEFERDFPDTTIIKLEQNYRSTGNILDVANFVIKNNESRKPKALWTDNEKGDKVVLEALDNEHDEAKYVADKVEALVREGYKYDDFAILYRTNAQSRNFEEAFIRRNIPYRLVGGLKFYGRKEIKDIVSYLNLIKNPTDDLSLKRIINVPKRGIGQVTYEKIEAYARENQESVYSSLLDIDKIAGVSKRAMNNINNFTSFINNLIVMKESMGVQEFIEKLIEDSGYVEELEKEKTVEAQSRIENIGEFISSAIDFEMDHKDGKVDDFLERVSLLSDLDRTEDLENSVTMLTVHSAKGLEYPVVFMVGMEEGLFPMSRALEDEDEVEEERRLAYVAITRSREKLFMTYAKLRTLYGRTNFTLPSRFIDEIPKELLDSKIDTRALRIERKENFPKSQVDKSKDSFVKKETRLLEERREENLSKSKEVKEGVKVRHKSWGQGIIVQVKERENDRELYIAFDGVGLKRVLLSIAPIEII